MWDKSSVKEIYDNRDIIAQIFDIKNRMDRFPDRVELMRFKQMYADFKERNDVIMYSDKGCKVTAEHDYSEMPVSTNDLILANLKPNNFVTKRVVLEAIKQEIKGMEELYLHLRKDELQIITGPVHFTDDVTIDKLNLDKYAKIDAENTFSKKQNFEDGFKVKFGSVLFNKGFTVYDKAQFCGDVQIIEGCKFDADNCIAKTLYLSTDKKAIANEYMLEVEKNARIGTNLTVGGDLNVTGKQTWGNLSIDKLKCDQGEIVDLEVTNKFTLKNAELKSNQAKIDDLEVINKFNLNNIKLESKQAKIVDLEVTEKFTLENAKLKSNQAEIKELEVTDKCTLKNAELEGKKATFNEIITDTISINKQVDSIYAKTIVAQNIFAGTTKQEQEFEVINTRTHYIFNNPNSTATFANRPTYSGEKEVQNKKQFITLGDIEDVEFTFNNRPTITPEKEITDDSLLTNKEIEAKIPFKIDEGEFISHPEIQLDSPLKTESKKWDVLSGNHIVDKTEVEDFLTTFLSTIDIIAGKEILVEV